ncbi:alpha-L-fucosidase 2-like [Phragmites australis]|uniref:alpha-L-fucosidase 2-like n=1 Tax=Phragmites australis TaxID=29695 RepID=UPI002D7821AA|nr:alpha-L-fucosidase 2-like [Phragmites australis]
MDGGSSGGGDWVWLHRPTEAEAVAAASAARRKWSAAVTEVEEERPLKVVFASPAEYFTDAAPIGNGSLGGMVWGGVATEKLQLNHDTLWTGAPGNYTDPDAPAALAVVRGLVDQGRFADATAAATRLFGGQSEVYQPLGDVNLDFGASDQAYDSYKRELDLHTATVVVTYNIGAVQYTREHFCSNPHQVIVTRISASKPGQISCTLSLSSQLNHNVTMTNANEMVMEGICPGQRPGLRKGDSNAVTGIKFAAVLGLQMGESTAKAAVLNDQKLLRLDNADWVVIVVAASSSFSGPFVNPSDSKLEPTSIALNTLNITRNLTFDQLKAAHLDDYQRLFYRVTLQLSRGLKDDACGLMTEKERPEEVGEAIRTSADRVESFSADEDPSLVELLFQYGRYLLISCSRPGTQVSNLQGIWSQDVAPAWDAVPHLNINLQMNYWPALPCNLSECQEPLFDFLASLAVNGSKTAKVNYEASGWVTHHVSDIWAKSSAFIKNPKHAVWPMGGAWLCTHLWEHYQFSLDKDFLENSAYPLLEGCATFLVDWLIEGPGGYLETNPSTSPEHAFVAPDGQPASVSYSTTMDISIIREVFSAVLLSAEVLGKSNTVLAERIKKALPRLPPIQIARDRTIMEWALDFQDPEVRHRHLSHLFGLYPGHTITMEKSPDVCEAVANSLYKRGEDGPGWSTTWKMALWARLLNSENAYRMVLKLITLVPPGGKVNFEGGLYSNLWTAHPPFQIDANFGFTAAIAEMLVQSTQNDLYLLPALPRGKWPRGCVKGLRARGDVTVNICWDEGELQEAMLWSNNQNSVTRLHYGECVTNVIVCCGSVYKFNRGLQCLEAWPLGK